VGPSRGKDLTNKKEKFQISWKMMVKSVIFVLLAITIKSMCQYFFGAEETSLEKIILMLDYPFHMGCICGGIIMGLITENWNYLWETFLKSILIKFDSGDESSEGGVKKSLKGKDKATDSNISAQAAQPEAAQPEAAQSQGVGREPSLIQEGVSSLGLSPGVKEVRFKSVGQLTLEEKVFTSLAAGELAEDTRERANNLLHAAELIKKLSDNDVTKLTEDQIKFFDAKDKYHIDNFLIQYLQRHAKYFGSHLEVRALWIKCRLINVETIPCALALKGMEDINAERDRYTAAVRNIGKHDSPTTQVKVFYSLFNEHKKIITKELNKVEDIMIKEMKKGPWCLVDHKDCKEFTKSLNEYNRAKAEFNSKDNYLKKKIGELINRSK